MKKSYIIVLIFLGIYLIITLLVFGSEINKKSYDTYMIIGNNTWLQLSSNNKWSEFNNKKVINKNKFYVYDNNEYKGKYTIQNYNSKWYIFDENNDSIKLNGDFTAVSSKDRIQIIDFELDKIIDINDSNIKTLEKKYDLEINNLDNLSINQKISLDFDNDKKEEELYFISNMFNEFDSNSKGFSFVYYVDNEKLKIIIDDVVEKNYRLSSYNYTISNIIDYNNDSKYEIIVSNNNYNYYSFCHSIYKLNWGKYEPIKSCN